MKRITPYRRISVFILMMSLFALSTQKEFILADYLLNTQHYAEKCVNTEIKEMHCNGKCQLAKKMKATEDNSQKQQPESQTKLVDILLFCEKVAEFKTPHITLETLIKGIPHELIVQETKEYNGFLLHPPTV